MLERATGVNDTVYDFGGDGASVAVNQGTLPLSSAGTQYILDDGQGNATHVTSATSLTLCDARFDPWGNPYGTGTGPAQPCTGGTGTINKHFYREGRLDESTGYYQLGSRTYAPQKASFLEPDTYRSGTAAVALSVGTDPLTRNRYSYVNGDPVNATDPSGHCTEYNSQGDPNACWHGSAASTARNTDVAVAQQAARSVCDVTCEAILAKAAKTKRPEHTQCSWFNAACNARGALDGYESFVRNHSDTFKAIASVASLASGVLGIAAVGCAFIAAVTVAGEAVCGVLEGASLVAGGVALIADSSLAAAGRGSLTDVVLDAVGMVPAAGSFAIALKLRNAARLWSVTLRAGDYASSLKKTLMFWKGAQQLAQQAKPLDLIGDTNDVSRGVDHLPMPYPHSP